MEVIDSDSMIAIELIGIADQLRSSLINNVNDKKCAYINTGLIIMI